MGNVLMAETSHEPTCPIDKCDDSECGSEPRTGVFRGIYTLAFEHSKFQADGCKCEWWMSGDIEALTFTLGTGRNDETSAVRVEVEGTLSTPGCYGHGGVSRRELRVSRVIAAEEKSSKGWKPLILKAPPTPSPPGPLPPEKVRE